MRAQCYKLDGYTPIPVEQEDWAFWYDDSIDERTVAEDELEGGVRVWTMFVGVDTLALNDHAPLLFATSILGAYPNGEVERHLTWDDALERHGLIVARLRNELRPARMKSSA
jgi:hypothetical protein